MKLLSAYGTLVFDCDGVILNSNGLKTDAFYRTALPFGTAAAQALVDFHLGQGGVSRYAKFERFLGEMVQGDAGGLGIHDLLITFASLVRSGLMTCEIAEGLEQLRSVTAAARWVVVSGGDQTELREVFRARGIDRLFDGEIFGSPDTKPVIVEREISNGRIVRPALFLGDSRLDHEVATKFGMDFVFMSGWTEMRRWREYCSEKGIASHDSISKLRASMLPVEMGEESQDGAEVTRRRNVAAVDRPEGADR